MLTEFGKALRKLRIDQNQLLKNMADRLGITASYLSAVEHGKREIPSDWVLKLREMYNLDDEEYQSLVEAYENSLTSIKIDVQDKPLETVRLANAFARRLDELDKEDINNIMRIMNKKEDEDN